MIHQVDKHACQGVQTSLFRPDQCVGSMPFDGIGVKMNHLPHSRGGQVVFLQMLPDEQAVGTFDGQSLNDLSWNNWRHRTFFCGGFLLSFLCCTAKKKGRDQEWIERLHGRGWITIEKYGKFSTDKSPG